MKKALVMLCAAAVAAGMFAGCGARDKKGDSSASESQPSQAESGAEGGEGSASEEVELVQFETPGEDDLIATIKTSMGEIKVVLYPQYAPKAVENFKTHAENSYYNGVSFHRVIEDFMIQSGDPKGDGTGGESIWGEPFEDEFTFDLWNFRGALSMANPGTANSNGSQFFIVQAGEVAEETLDQMEGAGFPEEVIEKYKEVGGTPWLDHKHTVFGQVVSGIETVDKIAAAETDENDAPVSKIIIESITFNK